MPKRQKSSKGRDIISNLPDFIIGHILSFLNTNDAVRTSVLSKRWMYMWTFVTNLTFFDSYRSSSNFSDFVCRVLFHLNSASIEDFFLSIREDYDPYVNQWLSAVLNRRVKKLTVHSWFKLDLSSCPLFQSPSLEEMWLQMTMRGRCIINVPTFASLPSLTVLKLTGITFTCYSSNKLKELTLKFPLLRKYFTTDCTWSGFKSITLEAPLLEEVTIVCSTPLHKSHTEIKLCVSHVTKFYYCGFISLETILLNGHIASAQICLQNSNDTTVEEKLVFVRKLLNLFTNTKCLQLCFIDHLQCLARLEHYLPGIPAFGVLDHLQLCWVTREVLLSLLLKSPCLKTLVLEMKDCDAEKQNFAIVPDCFLSTLKVVKFESFSGGECELSFAKFVMENARVLERIGFSFNRKLPSSKVKKAKAKLFLFKRSFSTVIMEFSTHGY